MAQTAAHGARYLADLPAVVNFGGGANDAKASIAELRAWRPQGPRMAGEYWAGWFEQRGEQHHRQSPEDATRTVEWIVQQGISFNLDMFQGCSSLGGRRRRASWYNGAGFWRASLTLARPVDTFLDTRGWGKGQVWVHGHHLGRY